MGYIIQATRSLVSWPIKIYQYVISPWLGLCCRFHPTCSHYALASIREYGVFKGGLQALWRLMRCHPWSQGGYDPVASKKSKQNYINLDQ